jgi:hypothetical protein
MNGRELLIVSLIVLLPPLRVGSCVIHDDLLDSAFQKVTPGMKRQDVEALLDARRDSARLYDWTQAAKLVDEVN